MTWLILALAAALCTAVEAAWIKEWFSDLMPWETAATPFFWSTPAFIAILLIRETPPIQPDFLPTLAMLVPIVTAGFYFQIISLRMAPLSLTFPFLAFTPVIVVFASASILGEHVAPSGLLGVLLVVSGAYVMNISPGAGWFAPFRAIREERGILYMLLAAALYGMGATLGKKLLLNSDPLFAASCLFSSLGITMTIIPMLLGKLRIGALVARPGRGIAVGAVCLLEIICHNLAISMTHAAYMVAIKRMNGVFAVIIGWRVLKESNITLRLAGAGLMTIGAIIIALASSNT